MRRAVARELIGLGAGVATTPTFGNEPSARLRLLGTRRWDGSDNLLVRYASPDAS